MIFLLENTTKLAKLIADMKALFYFRRDTGKLSINAVDMIKHCEKVYRKYLHPNSKAKQYPHLPVEGSSFDEGCIEGNAY